jgi:hypothetical protein
MDHNLSMSGEHYRILKAHLLPDDGKEAAALGLCGRRRGQLRERLVLRKLMTIPHDLCTRRSQDSIEWETDLMVELLEEARKQGLSVVKFHSHPGGYARFSRQDDESDGRLFPAIASWVEREVSHASVIMLGNGRMFGRVVTSSGFQPLSTISVAGDDLLFWHHDQVTRKPQGLQALPAFTKRHAKAFGEVTTRALTRLRVAVIGASGTGGFVIEELVRLGVGHIVIVDPDVVEDVNLNRILNATMADALAGSKKVHVAERTILRIGLGTTVEVFPTNLYDVDAVRVVAECDVVMGCVDSAEGRYLANRLATFYVMPYIDVGVALEADDAGAITQVCGYIHYIQPGRSSMLSRGAITMEQVSAEGLRRQNSGQYEQLRGEGYISNVTESRPAVISVNGVMGSMAVNELLARLHTYRDEPNSQYAMLGISLSQARFYPEPEPGTPCKVFTRHLGRGDTNPLLDLPELSDDQ